ncbi:carbohydrate kinase [Rouxiella badensis]|uniref:FGGY-family carbohydrate kinase n=1 Tax=Rouxiella badensis TaxID=1646377 RepID=UPI001B5C8D57|nr:FGGY-family carbohydrate kinase [Rouxiella badensis]MCC3745525.1 carbohydrate kinase [Rouxiella badensis]
MDNRDIILGIDSGTSVVKAVAFDLEGQQLGCASVRNTYQRGEDGSALQSMDKTWHDCVDAIRHLADDIENLASRVVALAVTAQGDGTWLVGKENRPVGDAWIWLDARAADTVRQLEQSPLSRERFSATGTGLNTCQQGAQLAYMQAHHRELLESAEAVMHCKDWLYLNLTGVRATDPSEASFTFGNFRHRGYEDVVIEALGLQERRYLLPEIVEGTQVTHPLMPEAAEATGLLAGTPVCLGYVDMVMTGLGAGVHTGGDASFNKNTACSIIGSTGVHMRSVHSSDVFLNQAQTGYVITLPIPHQVTQMQTNMAATLNLDWLLNMTLSLIEEFGGKADHATLVKHLDKWLENTHPDELMYHPYISLAGERGPFVNADARASFIGLRYSHGYADLLRAVIEGIGMAARDCYRAMSAQTPLELRLSGGAVRSAKVRQILSTCIGAPVRVSIRDEAGAAGAAMMAAVAIGAYPDMESCIATWVTPLLSAVETPSPALVNHYNRLFETYRQTRSLLPPVWAELQSLKGVDNE